jgi:hypothetical protein
MKYRYGGYRFHIARGTRTEPETKRGVNSKGTIGKGPALTADERR